MLILVHFRSCSIVSGGSRRGSRIYVHVGVVVRMRIVDWGIGRLERNVAKPIDARDGSGMSWLTVHGQNGRILFAILSQF